jgi:hypothetical protein
MAVLMLAAVLNVYAAKSSQLVQGTVIHVQEQRVQAPDFTVGGSNPADAPLTSRYYAFLIAIRVDCETYIGRYETVLNYLPSAFTAGRSISMRLTKHVMYFDLPDNPELRIGIVRRKAACAPPSKASCGQRRQEEGTP